MTLIAEDILSVQEVIAIKDSGINMKSEGLKVEIIVFKYFV